MNCNIFQEAEAQDAIDDQDIADDIDLPPEVQNIGNEDDLAPMTDGDVVMVDLDEVEPVGPQNVEPLPDEGNEVVVNFLKKQKSYSEKSRAQKYRDKMVVVESGTPNAVLAAGVRTFTDRGQKDAAYVLRKLIAKPEETGI